MGTTEVASRICGFVIPSYFHGADNDEKNGSKLRSTASLDGLRGIAALFVFFYHVLFSFSSKHDFGYGVDSDNTCLFQLPFLRLLYSGHAMVTIFFVVGGYVLSIKPVQMMHSRDWKSLIDKLASTCFRRGFRLYIPAFVATFITMLTISLGFWEFSRSYITDDHKYIVFEDHHIERLPFLEQLTDWARQASLLTNFFNYWSSGYLMPWYPRYDPHLWTIPVEMRSSMLLMLLLLSLARCKVPVRIGLMVLTILFVGWWDHWELVCYLLGSLLYQIDFLTLAKQQDPGLPISAQTTAEKVSTAGTTFSFILGLYLLSTPPQKISETPGFGIISAVTPSCYTDAKRFPFTIGAGLLVYSLLRSSMLSIPFTSKPAQYLGKISFSLYIVHGPLIHMIGFSLIPSMWECLIGTGSNLQWILGILLGGGILLVIVLGAADAFHRYVENWSVMVSNSAERWAFD